MKSSFRVDFIGVAGMRCGTTWIYRCLAEHPQICFSSQKETCFFNNNYLRGLEYYKSFFKHCNCDKKIRGEFTPAYYIHEKIAERIRKHFPDVKILACLRNPIERILSHYRFKIKIGQKVHPSLAKELSLRPAYLIGGFYYQHLNRFFKYFDPENILILIYEDALNNPAKFIKNIYKFLGVNENFVPTMLHKRANVSPEEGKMDKTTREMLREMYKDDIEKLEKLIRRDLSLWK